MQPDDKITVYSFRRCPFAMRVRMALHEKGIAFEVIEEDLKNFSEELRKLHPEAKVPVLVHGTHVVYESAIITEYIEEAFTDILPLMPHEATARAEVRLWTYWCNQIFKPALDRLKYGTSRFPENECTGIEAKVAAYLEKIESRLTKAKWLVTDSMTLADIHVFPFCRQFSRIKPVPVFLPNYPALLEWIERISERPSFKKTLEE